MLGFEHERQSAYYTPYTDRDDRMLLLALLREDVDVDGISVSWYEERGATAGPSVFELADTPGDLAAVFVLGFIRCDGACEERFVPTSGRVTVTEARLNGERLEGVLEQVILQEGTFDKDTQESTIFPDGRRWCLERMVMSAELNTLPVRSR